MSSYTARSAFKRKLEQVYSKYAHPGTLMTDTTRNQHNEGNDLISMFDARHPPLFLRSTTASVPDASPENSPSVGLVHHVTYDEYKERVEGKEKKDMLAVLTQLQERYEAEERQNKAEEERAIGMPVTYGTVVQVVFFSLCVCVCVHMPVASSLQ